MSSNILDPIQGFDVDVSFSDAGGKPTLVGRFTSILVRVVNVTETYLELNQRIPRHLDGEVNIVWQCERGMLNTNVLQDTFGFFTGNQISRNGSKIKRAQRFQISFKVNITSGDFVNTDMENQHGQISAGLSGPKSYQLQYCKVDTMSFGATSGRNIVANQWQGTAEGIVIS